MKTNKSILKTFMAAAMMFVFASTANAQFPKIGKGTNIGKVIKNKAEGTVESIANKAVDKAQEKARKKMYEIVKKKVLDGKQMPECPWPMQEGVTKSYSWPPSADESNMNITYYLYDLPNISEAEVKEMKAKLDARYQANKKILMADQAGLFSQIGGYTTSLLLEVEAEQGRWDAFYGEIQQYMTLHMQGKIKGNDPQTWEIEWGFGDIMVAGDKAVLTVNKNNAGKYQFYGLASKQGVFAEDSDLKLINADVDRMKKIALLTEGLTTEFDDEHPAKGYENLAAQMNFRAKVYILNVGKALASNSPENIERQSMPKAGKLNASLKAKALAEAKREDPEVIDVVITSNSWKVDPLTRRSVSGYVIKKDKHGKRAFGRSWCQDYMGGGKYGSLRNYGVGLGSFYLK